MPNKFAKQAPPTITVGTLQDAPEIPVKDHSCQATLHSFHPSHRGIHPGDRFACLCGTTYQHLCKLPETCSWARVAGKGTAPRLMPLLLPATERVQRQRKAPASTSPAIAPPK